jgi:hypothetical protein
MNHHIPTKELLLAAVRRSHQAAAAEIYDRLVQLLTEARRAITATPPKPPTVFHDAISDRPHPAVRGGAYTVTTGGVYWRWSCGWHRFDPRTGEIFNHSRAIGHLAMSRLKKLTPTEPEFIHLPRPYGPWRRYLDTPFIWQLGDKLTRRVAIICTDGVKCFVRDITTDMRYFCMFTNLTEDKTIGQRRVNSVKATDTVKKPREKKVSNRLLDLL